MNIKTFRPGYIPDLPDQRDYRFAISQPAPVPAKSNMRSKMPPVYNQGALGSCVANAVAGVCQYNEIVQKKSWQWTPSRLFQYYNTRLLMGTVDVDSGSGIRDALRAAEHYGIVDENLWQYKTEQFKVRPPDVAYQSASLHPVTRYERVNQTMADMRQIIAKHHPIILGAMLYAGAFTGPNGNIPMPALSEKPWGGHSIVLCGYDDSVNRFILRNSWSAQWGDGGYGTLPYEYALNPGLAGDMWTIRSVR